MSSNLLTTKEAATKLGLSTLTLYDWLSQSDRGEFFVRGEPFTIKYFQGGRKGQGRIRIDEAEIDRLLGAMQSKPHLRTTRQPLKPQEVYPGITVPLGRPAV